MCGPQSPWEPQGGSSPALPLAFGLSLQAWERTDAVVRSFCAGGPDPSSPGERINMPEMKKRKLREVKSSAPNTQQAGTVVRQTLGLFGNQAHSLGWGLVGLATLFRGHLYPGSTPWVYLSLRTTAKVHT